MVGIQLDLFSGTREPTFDDIGKGAVSYRCVIDCDHECYWYINGHCNINCGMLGNDTCISSRARWKHDVEGTCKDCENLTDNCKYLIAGFKGCDEWPWPYCQIENPDDCTCERYKSSNMT